MSKLAFRIPNYGQARTLSVARQRLVPSVATSIRKMQEAWQRLAISARAELRLVDMPLRPAHWILILGLVVLRGPLLAQEHVDDGTVCFTHIGPQDKPMPEFCITRRGASAPATIPMGATTWNSLQDLMRREGMTTFAHPVAFGLFRSTAMPTGEIRFLPAGVMGKLATVLLAGGRLDESQRLLLQRLRLRLGQPGP